MARSFAPLFVVFGTILLINAVLIGIIARQFRISDPNASIYVTATGFLIAALIAVIGWAIGAWVAHRNARMQNTLTIIGARFAQATFVQQISTLNNRFGDSITELVSAEDMALLAISKSKEDRDALQSVRYILNYFEFVAACIVSGEIDLDIVRKNIRSTINYYYQKCGPYIADLRSKDPDILSNLQMLQNYLRIS